MKPTILTIDVGNTSTSLGLYKNGRIKHRHRVDGSIRSSSAIAGAIAHYADFSLDGAVIASVVPEVNGNWQRAVKKQCRCSPLLVTHQVNLGIPITYPKPASIGADRLANACGASQLYGLPVIVADFGTALTFDIVKEDEGYAGGVIAPGLPLMFSYLADKTSLLPRIKPKRVKGVVGKTTEQAMQIGAQLGYRGMIREIISELKSSLAAPDLKVCATGGFASWVLADLNEEIVINKDLTLYGLGKIYEFNYGD